MSLKDFQILSKLGEGAYSSVYKARRLSDNIEYALKKVKLGNLSDKEKQNALNEVRILASIRHQNIIGYKEAFIDELSNSLCIVMDYADNGDLFQKIVDFQKSGQLFPEQEIWHIFIQVVKGLKQLHDLKIMHRDLKSANVFLWKDGNISLGDMNVSKVAKKGLLYTQTGTPYYASPEVWKDQPYEYKSDIWSLGCVLYEMTTLKPPFRAEDMEGLYKKVIRGYYPRIPPHFSQDLANVIRALLQVAPHLRPSCDKILQLPAVIKRMNEQHLVEADEGIPFLLNTIKVPKNIHYLTDRLPKPNYNPLKMRKIDKQRFLQTLAGHQNERIEEINNSPDMIANNQKLSLNPPPQPQQQLSSQQLPRIGGASKPSGRQQALQQQSQQQQLVSQPKSQATQNDRQNSIHDDNDSLIQQQITDLRKKRRNRKVNQNEIDLQQESQENPLISRHDLEEQRSQELKKLIDVQNQKRIDENDKIQAYKKKKKKNNSQIPQPIESPLQIRQYEIQEVDVEQMLNQKKRNPLSIHQNKNTNKYEELSVIGNQAGGGIDNSKVSKLPKINSSQNMDPYSGGVMLPSIGRANQNLIKQQIAQLPTEIRAKDQQKIKEISRAYKVPMENLDDLKERYRSLKKMEKRSKNTSVPQKNIDNPLYNNSGVII